MIQKDLEILAHFVDAIVGAGPFTGQWGKFCEWMDENGYNEAEIEAAMESLNKKIGRC